MTDVTGNIAHVRAVREQIFNDGCTDPQLRGSLSDIKRVVIINSASRSGSSLLYALLRKLPHVYALTGEAAPFYKLNTDLTAFNPHVSDTIPVELLDKVIDLSGLSRDFLGDLSLAGYETTPKCIDIDSYSNDLIMRFVLQWPTVNFSVAELKSCIHRVFNSYTRTAHCFDTEDFYLELLAAVNAQCPEINPFYYDIGTDRVALRFPFLEIPCGPPNTSFTLEEPPFILAAPRRKPSVSDFSDKILLLKSTVDCYRMNLIEKIFANADIRIIHLVRNPAATINGMFDGWLHRGFFSHNLETCFSSGDLKELNINGYSDRFPFGKFWWNFDLPPGWQNVADRDLVDVCAFQWHSANTEILNHLERTHRPTCTVHFEDIIRSFKSRREQFERLMDFMEVSAEQVALLELDALPVVQATLPPQLYRWKKRADMIARVLNAPRIQDLAERFGYFPENMDGWL